jgi:Na+-translocating ferredoxin:NAD+ oxidoreductase subunit E
MNKYVERLYNGIIKENPTFIIMLGMCPTLAVTTSAFNGIGMGLTTTVVLAASNLLISALRKAIPDKVRIPAYIVVVASLVTVVQLLLEAYIPVLNELLGIYIPLIVVNCIILGRAEAYAAKNSVGLSLFDGIGMGLGFTVALTIIGAIREVLGAGSVLGFKVTPASFEPISIFILAPGAFFVLSVLTALQNKFKLPSATNGSGSGLACGGDCSHCAGNTCATNHEQLSISKKEIAAAKETNKTVSDKDNAKN